jgi:hypothetical protein
VGEKNLNSKLSELAELTQRVKRASETTAKLAQDHRFLAEWYGMRPRSGVRPEPILDER